MFSKLAIFIIALIAFIGFNSVYKVDETQRAILFQLGKIKQADIKPGLHFKTPFINNVQYFDARVLELDEQPDLFLTSEKKNVKVDFFVKWRIDNVRSYYVTTGGNEDRAKTRLVQIITDELRDEFAKRTIQEAIAGERDQIMSALVDTANEISKDLGIQIIDIRVSRIDLPDQVSQSVYDRMRAERDRVANDFRARGREEAERIRAAADRERTVTLANAYRESEQVRGDGDAKAAEIYAEAYGKNEEFYSFTRSLNAYVNTFGSNSDDILILEPDSKFFQYFKDSKQ